MLIRAIAGHTLTPILTLVKRMLDTRPNNLGGRQPAPVEAAADLLL
jgi:hypothetical protein